MNIYNIYVKQYKKKMKLYNINGNPANYNDD